MPFFPGAKITISESKPAFEACFVALIQGAAAPLSFFSFCPSLEGAMNLRSGSGHGIAVTVERLR